MIPSTERRAGPFNGTGALVAHPFSFKVFEDTDIAVTIADTDGIERTGVLDSDYLVTLNVDQDSSPGGSVTYAVGGVATALPVGYALAITGARAYEQQANLPQGSRFTPEAIEAALDSLEIQLQQLRDDLSRTAKISVLSSPGTNTTLPIPNAGSVIGWNDDGTALQNYDPNSVDLSVATLTADLASTANALKNSGQLGFNALLNYTVNTIGWAAQRTGITPTMCGAVGDGVTDDTAAIQAWANSTFPKVGEPKTFKVTGTLTFAANTLKIDGRGMVIDASSGTFTNGSVLYCEGSLSALPALSASPAQNAVALTFASAHGLAERDVFVIYNPTNSSWSSKQTYYRAGEFCKVTTVPTGATVKLTGGLYAGYTAANVSLYKLATNEVMVRDLKVIAPNTGTMSPIRVRLATRVRMSGFQGLGSDYTGINLDRCYDVDLEGCDVQVPVQVAASKYGISVGNSQHVRIRGCFLESFRHAVNIGGDDFTGSVPNRDVWITDSYLANDADNSGVSCADIHGNSQHIYYVKCQIKGGASFGGKDCHYWDCDILDSDEAVGSLVLGGSEWLGGVAEIKGGSMYGSKAYTLGLVRLFTDANVNSDSTLIIDGVTVRGMPLCDTFARCDLSASTYKVNAVVRNITFVDGAPTLSNILRMNGTGAAGDGDFIIVDGIENAKAGAALYVAANGYGSTVKTRLMRQSGVASVALNTGAAFTSVTPTFRLSYGSKIPSISASIDTRSVDSIPLVVAYRLKSATAVTFDIGKANNANPTTGPTVAVDWSAGVSEI